MNLLSMPPTTANSDPNPQTEARHSPAESYMIHGKNSMFDNAREFTIKDSSFDNVINVQNPQVNDSEGNVAVKFCRQLD
jgi:hypothetical protein